MERAGERETGRGEKSKGEWIGKDKKKEREEEGKAEEERTTTFLCLYKLKGCHVH